MISTEWAVVVLLIAIYLVDCIVLVARGQALLERAGRKWRMHFGAPHYVIRDCPVVFLNPLTPWNMALKTAPLFGPSVSGAPRPSVLVRAFAARGLFVGVQAVLVLGVLPVLLYRNAGWSLVLTLALAYANAIVMLVSALLAYRKQGVPVRPIVGLGLTGLACIPLSVNFVRRASLTFVLDGDAQRFIRLLRGRERDVAQYELAAHVSEAIAAVDEGSSDETRLVALRAELLKATLHERT